MFISPIYYAAVLVPSPCRGGEACMYVPETFELWCLHSWTGTLGKHNHQRRGTRQSMVLIQKSPKACKFSRAQKFAWV